jgi:hypothetical protein
MKRNNATMVSPTQYNVTALLPNLNKPKRNKNLDSFLT